MSSEPMLKPLRETADRVGREVEIFAEKLDSWKTQAGLDPKERRKAAFGLVHDYAAFAQEAVDHLNKEHKTDRRQNFAKQWKQNQGNSFANSNALGGSQIERELRSSGQGQAAFAELKRWQSELDTWRLLEDILEFLYPDTNPANLSDGVTYQGDRFEADGSPFRDFTAGNTVARERVVILKWLEEIAESTENDMEVIEERLEDVTGRGKGLWDHGWMDTREKLKGEKRLRLWDTTLESELPNIENTDGTALLITQLDPDAATRQDRKLEAADSDFENSFWTVCWEMFRRGMALEEIREWCQDRNQFARAQSMGAQHSEAQKQPLGKNINARLMWRRTCRYAARNGGMNAHERAIFGLLSGDYKAMEPICASWDDYLYANVNALLLSQYEAYVLEEYASCIPKNGGYSFGIESGVSLNENPIIAIRRIIASFQQNPISRITTHVPYKCIQSALVTHDFPNMIFLQGVALSRRVIEIRRGASVLELIPPGPAAYLPAEKHIALFADDCDILRVLAHILIIFQLLGYTYPSPDHQLASENILAAYIDVLRNARKLDPLPVYASSMSQERAEITMARVLPAIVNPSERMEYMQLIKAMDIDVYEVLTYQLEFALEASAYEEEVSNDVLPLRLLEPAKGSVWPHQRIRAKGNLGVRWEDEYIIRSMQWWPLVDGEWTLTFVSLTDVAKRFLGAGRLTALIEMFDRLSLNAISTAKTPAILGKKVVISHDHEESDDDETSILQTSTRSSQAHETLTTRAPMQPQSFAVHKDLLKAQSRTYAEIGQMVAALKSIWKWRKVEDDYIGQSTAQADASTTARQSLRKHLEELVACMEPLLGDFLTHARDESEAVTLRAIREAYLPELVLAYNSALHSAAHLISRDHLLQSLDLATNVAENEELIRCFAATSRMGELVDAFALSSKTLLRLNEQAGKGAKKRRGRRGETLGIWDIDG